MMKMKGIHRTGESDVKIKVLGFNLENLHQIAYFDGATEEEKNIGWKRPSDAAR
ncbi:hypothetical protein JW998_14160 [candidate division KSB1 bacterium]|nr:hypothetical protein [candidate division KSB1 bacterium]